MTDALLDIKDVVVEYPSKGFRKKPFKALKGVSLDIRQGETVGLVGESGSGKTTLGRAVLGLAPVTGGSIKYRGQEISKATRAERRVLSHEIQVVFQDPFTSLNPSMTIEQILTEPLTVRKVGRQAANERVAELLDQDRLPLLRDVRGLVHPRTPRS
jgi:peptide/nickel transport system ATP-binding protein